MTRIDDTFARLKSNGTKAFVSYIMAGDTDYDTALAVMKGLPDAGVDIIELGVPFTFRTQNDTTPIVLMGYYNPIYSMGVDKFLAAAKDAGIDGLIVVVSCTTYR